MSENPEYLEYRTKMNAVKLDRIIRLIKQTRKDYEEVYSQLGNMGWTDEEEHKIIADWWKKYATEDKEIAAVYNILDRMEADMKTLWKKQNKHEF